ncbi:hypothetical protein K488DRAFT_24049, partial [Vararia minispora EC-137]
TANLYPFPKHANPTPFQLFHLPSSATQADIKARYFELVRVYHPDSPLTRFLPPETVQSQFQAISRAYEVLRGKRPDDTGNGEDGTVEAARQRAKDLSTAMWKVQMARRADLEATFDDRWEGRFVVGLIACVR